MIEFEDKTLNRLLTLSEKICILEDELADLSAKDLESSPPFKKYVKDLNELLDKESIIINTLSLDKINKYQKILSANDKHDDTAVAFNRLFQLIQDKLDERDNTLLFQKEEKHNNNDDTNEEDDDLEISLEPNEDAPENLITDEIEEEVAILDDYYIDSFELDKYLINVIDRTSLIVIKKMYDRINTTTSDNKTEAKYKKQLLKYLKQFKYYIFCLDYKIERLAAKHSFNLNSIPEIKEPDIDLSPLYHNQSIDILDTLYSSSTSLRKSSDILKLLYELMCLEEYTKKLDKESLTKLLSFCEKLETIPNNDNNFGQYGKQKIKQRLGNS